MSSSDPVRVRFAPSPTGQLHVGGARTALFNWLFARSRNGVFILRIEDTDLERSTSEAVDQIFGSLSWLGLDWDEGPDAGGEAGPYFQSQRREKYEVECDRLLEQGRAYRCFCTAEAIAGAREEARAEGRPYVYGGSCRELNAAESAARLERGDAHVIRLSSPAGGITRVGDLVRGEVEFENDLQGDFIIVRSNGMPTYNFAAAVDDCLMAITHVIRGDDHLPNTPKQIQVIEALGHKLPLYAHLPLILGSDRSPLSKRHGSVSVEEFRNRGFLREALVNYLALLGWSFDGETTLFSIDELVRKFSLDRVSSTGAVFDNEKLLWMNGSYIRSLDETDLSARLEGFLPGTELEGLPGKDGRPTLATLVPLVREKLKTLEDFIRLTDFFFLPFSYEAAALAKLEQDENALAVLVAAAKTLREAEPFSPEVIESDMRELAAEMDIKLGRFLQPIRIAVSGRTVTPGMFETLAVLGREASMKRVDAAIDLLQRRRTGS